MGQIIKEELTNCDILNAYQKTLQFADMNTLYVFMLISDILNLKQT